MSVYEVHLGSWARVPEEGNRFLTYTELAARLVPYVKELGFTHIELLPVMEHPFSGSWGYQVLGFFAPTSRFGTPQEFKYFIDACHQAGLGVILDWVPGHFPKDQHGLARFDGTALFEHADPRQGEHQDWGTLIFNYGRNEVRNFLLSNALFWLDEYHLDGLRVDAVASMLYLDYSRKDGEWIPNQYGGRENLDAIVFLQELNRLTHGEYPGSITAAEESDILGRRQPSVHLGGLGFTYKWNMGWMHDMLYYVKEDPVHRRWHHNQITFSMRMRSPRTSSCRSRTTKSSTASDRCSIACPATSGRSSRTSGRSTATCRHPGKNSCSWAPSSASARVEPRSQPRLASAAGSAARRPVPLRPDLNWHYAAEPALHRRDFTPDGFSWIDCNDNENSVVSMVRFARDRRDCIVMVFNFTPVPRHGYRIGVPQPGRYTEILNSDSEIYGGGNIGNLGGLDTEPMPSHGFDQSISLTVPPLGCVYLKPRSG
jgi:1,4-alpha-glucan branching enzyme